MAAKYLGLFGFYALVQKNTSRWGGYLII